MEVIYTGLRQTPEQIVNAALQEDADVIGLSILSGAHTHICPRLMQLVREKRLDDLLVLIGGIIPDVDLPALREMGISGVFQPGTPMQEIIDFIHRLHQNACKLLFINCLLVYCTPLFPHCTPHSERDFPAPRTPAVDRSGLNLCRPPPHADLTLA